MFTNKVGCTIYEKTVKDRMEAYVRHFIPTIYWEQSRGQTQSGTGTMKQQDSVLCIIPASSLSDYIPKRDDRIVCGNCEKEEPTECGAYTVMSVENFRFGSAEVQHLEVTAE